MGIAAAAAGQQPTQISSCRRVPLPHQGQDAGAFGEHKAVSTEAVGPGSLIGGVVAVGEGAHGGKANQPQSVHRCFAAPGQHQIGAVVVEQHLAQHQCFGAGGAGGHRGVGSTEQTELNGDLASGGIGDQHRHGKGVDPARSPRAELRVLLVHRGEAADAGADHHRDATWIETFGDVPRHGPGLPGGHQGQLGTAIGAAAEQGRQAVEGTRGDATGQAHGQILGPGRLKGLNAAAASDHRLPGAVGIGTEWVEGTPTHHCGGFSSGSHRPGWGSGTPGAAGCPQRCGTAAALPP